MPLPALEYLQYLVQQVSWTSWAKSKSHNSDCIWIYSHFLNRFLPPVIWYPSYKKMKGFSNVLQKSYSIRNINSNPHSLFTLSYASHALDNFLKSYNTIYTLQCYLPLNYVFVCFVLFHLHMGLLFSWSLKTTNTQNKSVLI